MLMHVPIYGIFTVCFYLKMEFRSCARGRQWCSIFHYHWWTASIKPRLLFSHSGLVSWGLPFLQFNFSRFVFIRFRLFHFLGLTILHNRLLQLFFLKHLIIYCLSPWYFIAMLPLYQSPMCAIAWFSLDQSNRCAVAWLSLYTSTWCVISSSHYIGNLCVALPSSHIYGKLCM